MHVLMITVSLLAAAIGLGYLILGRNRYGNANSRPFTQLTARAGSTATGSLTPEPCRTVRVYFIKPSRYDDNGYVQFYRWGVQPNNTLTVLAALNDSYNRNFGSKRNVHLETVIWDEICDGAIGPETIAAIRDKAREDGVELLVGISGVQSNQYPRGRDVALQFVAQGITTVMGGFHVSGYPQSRDFLHSCGVSTAVGEAENYWCDLIEDFLDGQLKPNYSVSEGIRAKTGTGDILVPVITDAQLPMVNDRYLTRFFNDTQTTLDTSRGCPFTCSYCSVKNVMGRTMRSRDPKAVVAWVRDAVFNHGIDSLFLVDDDFFRSPRWDEILTGMVEVKKEFPRLSFMMQVDVDASCFANVAEDEKSSAKHARSQRFVELAARAGCYQAFVGIESLNPENLNHATKYQNTEDRNHRLAAEESRARLLNKYRRVVDNWHKVGISVHAGYMLGFPFDGPDCGKIAARMLKQLGFDIVSFFIMTPLPGTEDQIRYAREGEIIDWDFNNLDSQHVTLKHDRMDRYLWFNAYTEAFKRFYSPARLLHTIFTVAGGRGLSAEARRSVLRQFLYYFFSYRQGRHPMVGGVWQIRRRDLRRAAVTDDEAQRLYLANRRFNAILHGSAEGFAGAPA
ncbi:MAG TPA: radical SAM protein [Candidatus Binataceae bacterium]|nr:radical SAM protein [Candidatus Binataceae bacterium]